jgi:hypothetical protein
VVEGANVEKYAERDPNSDKQGKKMLVDLNTI